MKITRKHAAEKLAFKPTTLEITIETEDELKALWGRLNPPTMTINNLNEACGAVWSRSHNVLYGLWSQVNDLAEEFGVKP